MYGNGFPELFTGESDSIVTYRIWSRYGLVLPRTFHACVLIKDGGRVLTDVWQK